MSTVLKQAGRLGKLHTGLGEDELCLLRFNGTDTMNGLFEYHVEALSENAAVDFDALVGTHATVEVTTSSGPKFYDGVVSSASRLGEAAHGYRYDLTLVPWLWLTRHRRNQRIFHNKKVDEILKELLAPYQVSGALYKNKCGRSYPLLEYTVQYRESDLQFACRMMERFGISYHFQHEMGKHTLVLTDGADLHDDIPGGSRSFFPVSRHNMSDEEHFWEWLPERNITVGTVRLTDYNFKKPDAAMKVERKGDASHAHGKIESFDYPGDYEDEVNGKGVVARRIAGERGNDALHHASGDVISLSSGLRVTVKGDNIPGVTGGTFLCMMATHHYVAEGYGSEAGGSGGETAYKGSYTLASVAVTLVPPMRARQPVVQGPQTAVVVGAGEIDCDEFGRILVKFHWDLEAAHSMRCRVSQIWAGQGWGGVAIPRIGMEVIVEFLEGDPDKPLVTGCVYNAKNMPPYALPAGKTRTSLRSNTHAGAGYNEISLEDGAGNEDMFLHAQKDLTVKVLNNESSNVKANRVATIGANDTTSVTGSSMQRVGKSHSVIVGGQGNAVTDAVAAVVAAGGKLLQKGAGQAGANIGDFGGIVSGVLDAGKEIAAIAQKKLFGDSGEHKTIAGTAQAAAGKAVADLLDKIMPSSGIMTTTVEKFRSDTTGIASTEQVGAVKTTVVGGAYMIAVGAIMKIVVGAKYSLQANTSITARTKKHTLNATEKFVIAGPGGSITIDSSGITIKAIKLDIKSPSVNFTAGAPDMVEALSSDKPFVQDCKK